LANRIGSQSSQCTFADSMGIATSKKLLAAASRGREQESVALLRSYLIDPNYTNSDGDSALHLAAANNLIQLTTSLLSFGVHLNKKNKFESNPLHIAVRMGHDQIVRLLLRAGCDVNTEAHQGLNALTIAASCNNLSVARLLLEHRARIQEVALIFASLHEDGAEMVRMLLNHGATVNGTDEFGNTALMQSAALSHEKVVEVLVSREWAPIISVDKQNQFGWSALHFAYSASDDKSRERVKANTINLLLKKGAKLLIQDNEGRKPQDVTPHKMKAGEPPAKRRRVDERNGERINKDLLKEFDAHAQCEAIRNGQSSNAEELADDRYDSYSDPKGNSNKRKRNAAAKPTEATLMTPVRRSGRNRGR